ncbi:hypothetical protein M422DRAFT_785862 [Sphaerobolus stellatus SS14]|uniref:Uncharacterized protein n=1 Tax=Sphaerobolus stellatus (strain SS14) TaxID=990650 RepID=A0A0C9T6E7_SPHS4|nr:hypothetical protein M422DRAFT_785862 [Sphaerobolus stellatus SS14]
MIEGSAVAWAANALGENVSFIEPSYPENNTFYMIPKPQEISTLDRAIWLTDVAVLKPSCSWVAPRLTTDIPDVETIIKAFNETSDSSLDLNLNVNVSLISQKLQVTLDATELYFFEPGPSFEDGIPIIPPSPLSQPFLQVHLLEQGRATDPQTGIGLINGRTVWFLRQLLSCPVDNCANNFTPKNASAIIEFGPPNVASAPFIDFGPEAKDNVLEVTIPDNETIQLIFLYCSPNTAVETRKIYSDGLGNLHLGPKSIVPQRNLDLDAVNFAISTALSTVDQAGPEEPFSTTGPLASGSAPFIFGNELQFTLLFGEADPSFLASPVSDWPSTFNFTLQSLHNITNGYTNIIRNSMKTFLSGSMGTKYVPGKIPQDVTVFTVSQPYLIASTVLYSILLVFTLVTRFRRPVPQFTFVSVALALRGSNVPSILAGQGEELEEETALLREDAPSSLRDANLILEEGRIMLVDEAS